MQKRAYIIYSGKVQGVGFRWATEAAANSAGLTGWVRNLPDGNVEVLCEGTERKINIFAEMIKKEMEHYIHLAKLSWQEPTGEFSAFSIKFYQ